jgi:predicted ATPase
LVAIKVVRRDIVSPDLEARFEREVQVVGRLQHPHVVPLYDSGVAGALRYYVMPLVEGPTLRDELDARRSLPTGDALRIAEQVAGALDHAHAQGVVHRDVKPENILLSGGHAVVTDFGIARTSGDAIGTATLTAAGFTLGTPAYLSPEQAAGERTVDGRSDQYALACVVYEMLAGAPPFTGKTAQQVIVKHFLEPVPSLGIEPRAPARALDAVLARALAKEAAARFATVGEFARALRVASLTVDTAAVGAPQLGASTTGSLPAAATPLVGRDELLGRALMLLRRPDVRLVTFTGAGGAGKTRLAMEAGARLRAELEGGVWFVSLDAVADPDAVPAAVRQGLGLPDVAAGALASEVAARLGGRTALLILDDFERHVAIGPWLAELLANAASLRVLVTSRVRLRLTPEHDFPVPPLEVPDLASAMTDRDVETYASVQLFAQRARAVDPSFVLSGNVAAVAEICVRLDGLPLAIELAAARVRLLPPPVLLSRLKQRLRILTGGARDLPTRHQALRDTIAWSYDVLREPERRLFARLAAFAGGCTLEAAGAVCGVDGQLELDVLDGTAVLLDASLLTTTRGARPDEPRVAMLETIREFALERLQDDPSAEQIQIAHREWYLALARRAAPKLAGAQQDTWLAVLAAEHANLGVAMEQSIRRGDAEAALALGASLWRYWVVRGHLRDGREWLDQALALPAASGATALRADVLEGAAHLAHYGGDLEAAAVYGAAAIELRREHRDGSGTARGLATLAWIAWLRCDYADARRLSADCLALSESLGDRRATAQALGNLGWVALYEGDLAVAQATFARALEIRRELADRRNVAAMLMALAWTASRAGDAARAFALLEEALPTFRAVGDDLLYAWALTILAENALCTGDSWRARSALESEALPLFRRRGDHWGIGQALTLLSWVERERGNLSRAERLAREALATRLAVHDAYGEAQSRAALGAVARLRGAESEARSLYEQSLEIRRRIGDRPGVEECTRALSPSPAGGDMSAALA